MSPPTLEIRELSERILEHALADQASATVARRLELAFMRLHDVMSTLVGRVGFAAVMTRAVHLTKRDCPALDQVEVFGDSGVAIEGFTVRFGQVDPDEVLVCATRLLACVIALLGSFIGHDLTLRLIRGLYAEGQGAR